MIEVKFEYNDIYILKKLTKVLEHNSIKYDIHSDFFIDFPINKSKSSISKIGLISFIFGLAVFVFAIYFQYWTAVKDYPINVGGKPFFSLIHSLPIAFELCMLFTGITAIIVFLFVAKLPFWKPIDIDSSTNKLIIDNNGIDNNMIIKELDKLRMNYIIK